jgi:hypothetical protein
MQQLLLRCFGHTSGAYTVLEDRGARGVPCDDACDENKISLQQQHMLSTPSAAVENPYTCTFSESETTAGDSRASCSLSWTRPPSRDDATSRTSDSLRQNVRNAHSYDVFDEGLPERSFRS